MPDTPASSPTAPHPPASAAESNASGEVGARLKLLRQMYGLSQRELAKRAGITNGTISLIEQNEVSPSIASLKKILAGFPISLSDFFSLDLKPRTQMFYSREELVELGGGPISLRQLGGNLTGRKLQVIHEHYQHGADTGNLMLTHEGEEAGIIVAGEIELTVGGRQRVLTAGEGYYFDSCLPHRFRNLGEAVCQIVSVCTPPTF